MGQVGDGSAEGGRFEILDCLHAKVTPSRKALLFSQILKKDRVCQERQGTDCCRVGGLGLCWELGAWSAARESCPAA